MLILVVISVLLYFSAVYYSEFTKILLISFMIMGFMILFYTIIYEVFDK